MESDPRTIAVVVEYDDDNRPLNTVWYTGDDALTWMRNRCERLHAERGNTTRGAVFTESQAQGIARHESEHAVVAHALGCKVLEVATVPQRTDQGELQGGKTWCLTPLYDPEGKADPSGALLCRGLVTRILIALAPETPSVDDWQQAITSYREFLRFGGTVKGGLDGCRQHARALAAQHAAAVDALASVLFSQKRLTVDRSALAGGLQVGADPRLLAEYPVVEERSLGSSPNRRLTPSTRLALGGVG